MLFRSLFWLVPIFYSESDVPSKFVWIYHYNPVAALVMAMRYVLLKGSAPPLSLLLKLSAMSLLVLAIGIVAFRRMERSFYDYL